MSGGRGISQGIQQEAYQDVPNYNKTKLIGGGVCCPSVERAEIPGSMDELGDNLSALEENLTQLRDRLQYVMYDETPATERSNNKETGSGYRSPLARNIQEMSNKAYRANLLLLDTIARLPL